MITRRRLVLVALLLLVGLVLLGRWLSGRAVSDEELLLQGVEEIAVAVEQRDLEALGEWIDAGFRDQQGRDFAEIKRFLRLHWLRGGLLSIYLVAKSARLGPARAAGTVEATVLITRRPRVERLADILPESARALRFVFEFQRRDRWRLVRASWRRVEDWRQLVDGASR